MKFNVLGVWLTGSTLPEVVRTMLEWVKQSERRYVTAFAAESVLKCVDSPHLMNMVNGADMVFTDGMTLVTLGRIFAKLDIGRCYGPDVMIHTVKEGCAQGVRHYFYGGANEGGLDKLDKNFSSQFPGFIMAGRYSPPYRPLTDEEKAFVVSDIRKSRADIVWVGIGTPKQDYWIGEFHNLVDVPIMAAVGAAFNFHAGLVRQAPSWMMRNGLEWFFRLCAEPRLWRRYVFGNPRFIFLVLKQWLTGHPVRLGEKKSEGEGEMTMKNEE